MAGSRRFLEQRELTKYFLDRWKNKFCIFSDCVCVWVLYNIHYRRINDKISTPDWEYEGTFPKLWLRHHGNCHFFGSRHEYGEKKIDTTENIQLIRLFRRLWYMVAYDVLLETFTKLSDFFANYYDFFLLSAWLLSDGPFLPRTSLTGPQQPKAHLFFTTRVSFSWLEIISKKTSLVRWRRRFSILQTFFKLNCSENIDAKFLSIDRFFIEIGQKNRFKDWFLNDIDSINFFKFLCEKLGNTLKLNTEMMKKSFTWNRKMNSKRRVWFKY